MTVFNFNGNNQKKKVSQQMSILLDNNCYLCYNRFNFGERAPYLIYPCQHQFCRRCVEEDILEGKDHAKCPECKNDVKKHDIQESVILTQVVAIVEKYIQEESVLHQIDEEDEARIAEDLFKAQIFYGCPFCSQAYNRNERQPFLICQNEHLMCSVCLKNKKPQKCPNCNDPILKEKVVSMKIVNASEFIDKVCFNERIKVVVNDKQFNITTHADTKIKHIFFYLQEFHHISEQVEINLCKFFAESTLERFKKTQINFNERIGKQIKTVIIKYDEQALKMGSKVTLPSKIMEQLPIKVSNFQPINQMKIKPEIVEEQQDIFGPKEQKVASEIYPSFSKSSSIKSKILEYEKPMKEENKYNEKQKEIVKKSSIFESLHQGERQMEIKKKLSMIQRSVKQKELPIGTQIPEAFVENVNSKILKSGRKDILKRFIEKHEVLPDDEQYLCFEIYKIVNERASEKELKESQKMQKKLFEEAKLEDTESLILLMLKAELEDGQIKVTFSPQSTMKSKLSLKVITSHYLSDRFVVIEKVDEDDKFYFEKMYHDEDHFRKYVDRQKKKYVSRFDLTEENIVIHNLIKGPNVLVFSTNEGHKLSKHLRHNVDKDIQIQPFFTQLELSPEDFDQKGFIQFPKTKEEIEFRGNWPYYQPIKCQRYGIKVKDKFDNGDNKWLRMSNQPGEWAVGFHGIRNPNQAYKHYHNVIQSVLAALYREEKSMLIVVENSKQAYEGDRCVNTSGKVGSGVYFSPMFVETLPFTESQKVGSSSYRIVFQCRLNPLQIRIPDKKQTCWVVGRPQAIRPYGIVLISDEKAKNYPSAYSQFKEEFSFEKYKGKISAVQNKSNSTQSSKLS